MTEQDILVDATETVPLTSDQDHSVDPMKTGFTWYKPAKTLANSHVTGGHTWTISGHDMQILTSTVPAGGEIITEGTRVDTITYLAFSRFFRFSFIVWIFLPSTVGSMVFMHRSMVTNVELTLCSKGGCSEGWGRICGGENHLKKPRRIYFYLSHHTYHSSRFG